MNISRTKLYIMKKTLKESIFIIVGCFLMAAGTSLFLLPNQLSSGGFTGIATITYYLFNIPVGTFTLLLNIPLFILTFIKVGKDVAIKGIAGTIILSIFIDLLDRVTPLTDDRFLACIYGGILSGIGTALVLKASASTGGSDLLSYIIKAYKPHYRTSNLIVIIDIVIIVMNVIFFKEIEESIDSVFVFMNITVFRSYLLAW